MYKKAVLYFALIYVVAVYTASSQEYDADQRLIVGRDAYVSLPNGQVYTADLSLDQKPVSFRFKDLDFYELAVVIVGTSAAEAPISLTVYKENIGDKKFQGKTNDTKSIVFQTRVNGDLLIDLSPPTRRKAEGLLSIYLAKAVSPPLEDFTLGADGMPVKPTNAVLDATQRPKDVSVGDSTSGADGAPVPEACVVDGGGVSGTDKLGDNPDDRIRQEARQKAFNTFKDKWSGMVTYAKTVFAPVFSHMSAGVFAVGQGLPKPAASQLFGALAVLPVVMFPDDQACNTALVQIGALPRVPVSCPWSLRQGTACYSRAYDMIDAERLNLAKLACIHAAERQRFDILFAAMKGIANGAGLLSVALNAKSEQVKKNWEDTYLTTAKNKKTELIKYLRDGLIELGRCEAEFGNFPGWYARVGFSYEATMNHIYEIK